ncbi:YciI family protein [Usitatibacter palustris]|uniref:YCII-related domain-containing protein n=1 Tax=Usitatibacter palustris TaxID=2732487 RepID=A0A6M4HAS1_9PROT|nr:YciI family protein [Usitatibacter palustris]QJR16760.1 hypothetical protein DSM104440_03596 [Usitatibacter palustris]
MRFMSIYRSVEKNRPPTVEEMTRMGALTEEMTKKGVLIATGGCMPSFLGARVRAKGGKLTVTDGPFTETKEIVGGFAIMECASKAEAIELAKTFLKCIDEDGECEVRQMGDEANCGGTAPVFESAAA